MPMKYRLWEWIAFAAFALFALYVAAEPFMSSPDDCISAFDILVLLPYYALLYFGTLPAFVSVAAWRIARGRRMGGRSRRTLNVAICALSALVILLVVAAGDFPYTAQASRCIDFLPAVVLATWFYVRIWPRARVPQGALP